ncbi:hypothetical protein GCM10027018_26770 [Paenibacillus thermoaerophilus]
MLAAQEEGKTAEEVFGKDPRVLADEIHEQLPREPFRHTAWFMAEILCRFLDRC